MIRGFLIHSKHPRDSLSITPITIYTPPHFIIFTSLILTSLTHCNDVNVFWKHIQKLINVSMMTTVKEMGNSALTWPHRTFKMGTHIDRNNSCSIRVDGHHGVGNRSSHISLSCCEIYRKHHITTTTYMYLPELDVCRRQIKTVLGRSPHWKNLKGLAQAKIIKNRSFYFGFLIWPYDVNMYID